MKLAQYTRYKPSGVEWFGDVPKHWQSIALKWISTRYSGGTPDRGNDTYWDEGTIPWINSGAVNQGLITEPSALISEEGYRNSSAKWVPEGALVMALAGQGKTKGMVAQTRIRTTCNQSMAAIVPRESTNPHYLYWLLGSQYEQIRNMAGGEQRDGLNLDILGSIPCLSFPEDEQCAIADFLDRETAKLDTLVEKKQALIEKLKEKRAALISRTVTRGLPPDAARAAGIDPHPKLKPSGIDWLGDVPDHWEVLAVRRCAKRIQTGGTPPTADERYYEDGTIPWYGPGSFDNRIEVSQPIKLLNEIAVREGVARLFAANATLIVTIGATLGKVSSLLEAASCNQQITVIEFDIRRIHSRFATYQIKRLEPTLRAIAPSATLPILDQGEIADILLGIPPIHEQRVIADYIDCETAKIDRMVEKVEAAIERLQEYRTALITAAVTGKIDVRKKTAA